MGLIDIIRGRKKVSSGDVDFSAAENIIDKASSQGIDNFDVTYACGPQSQRKKRSYKDLKTILKHFRPHEFSTEEEWVYRQELKASHEEYSSKDKDIHYLYLRNILYGGTYRSEDGGKKPHKTNDYLKVKFEIPKKSSKLKDTSPLVAIIGILVGLLFLSPNVTGNAIALDKSVSNTFGIIFLIIGVLSFIFFLNYRKQLRNNKPKLNI